MCEKRWQDPLGIMYGDSGAPDKRAGQPSSNGPTQGEHLSPEELRRIQHLFLQRIREKANRLMPYTGLVGVTADGTPVVLSPYQPNGGHTVFAAGRLSWARHFLDHFLYSSEAITPADKWQITVFSLARPGPGDSLFFAEHPSAVEMNWRQVLQTWAHEKFVPPEHYLATRIIVFDDLGRWVKIAREDETIGLGIRRILDEGLEGRLWVLATTTYESWYSLSSEWRSRERFAVGVYADPSGSPRTILGQLPQKVRQLQPY